MDTINKRITILSKAERAALYELPDFDGDQRLEYFNLTDEEQKLMQSRTHISFKVYCALQIGYFKAKHLFFRFVLEEVKEDFKFILQQYFSEQDSLYFKRKQITNHERYTQCYVIAKHFGYQFWSPYAGSLLRTHSLEIIRRDISPQFIVMELLQFLQVKKIIRPGYTTLQNIVSDVLNTERKRLSTIICNTLTQSDKSALQTLLKDEGTLSGLAEIKQDAKDFKVRMMNIEREKTGNS